MYNFNRKFLGLFSTFFYLILSFDLIFFLYVRIIFFLWGCVCLCVWRAGIMFQDITTMLLDPKAFKDTIDLFVERYKGKDISVVAGNTFSV